MIGFSRGHEGSHLYGELTALAFKPEGLPRRQRASVREIAATSAGHLKASIDRYLSRLCLDRDVAYQARHQAAWRRRLVPAMAAQIRALRYQQLGDFYRPDRIEAHLRALLRLDPKADHLFGGAFGPNLIVNAGEAFLVDAWQNSVELENMKFHGMGTGTVDPAEGDTALGTELTTQYNPDGTRATGSLGEASASVFRTVGTNTIDSGTPAVTEWGLFSQATVGGTLWSRIEFAAINLVANDSIQFTYDLTVE